MLEVFVGVYLVFLGFCWCFIRFLIGFNRVFRFFLVLLKVF